MASLSYSAHAFRAYVRPATLPATRATSKVFSSRRYFQNILAPTDPDANSPTLIISKLTPRGFILSDNLIVPGGAILHSGKVLLWDVDPPKQLQAGEKGGLEKVWEGWETERFGALEMLVPRPGQSQLLAFYLTKESLADEQFRDTSAGYRTTGMAGAETITRIYQWLGYPA